MRAGLVPRVPVATQAFLAHRDEERAARLDARLRFVVEDPSLARARVRVPVRVDGRSSFPVRGHVPRRTRRVLQSCRDTGQLVVGVQFVRVHREGAVECGGGVTESVQPDERAPRQHVTPGRGLPRRARDDVREASEGEKRGRVVVFRAGILPRPAPLRHGRVVLSVREVHGGELAVEEVLGVQFDGARHARECVVHAPVLAVDGHGRQGQVRILGERVQEVFGLGVEVVSERGVQLGGGCRCGERGAPGERTREGRARKKDGCRPGGSGTRDALPATSLPRARLVHVQAATTEVLSLERLDGGVRRGVVHLDEAEATRATRLAILDEAHGVDGAVGFEKLTNFGLARAEGEVSDVDLLGHSGSFAGTLTLETCTPLKSEADLWGNDGMRQVVKPGRCGRVETFSSTYPNHHGAPSAV